MKDQIEQKLKENTIVPAEAIKAENILKSSLDSIPSPSAKIQII